MKLQCSGPNKCMNEIDLTEVLRASQATKIQHRTSSIDMPRRVVLKCKHCEEGRVIVTGEMFWNYRFHFYAEPI